MIKMAQRRIALGQFQRPPVLKPECAPVSCNLLAPGEYSSKVPK